MAYYRLPEKELRAYCEAVMGKYGFNEKQSRDIADILLTADLQGLESHGVQRLIRYHRGVKSGVIRPDAVPEVVHETPLSVVLDAHSAMGQIAAVDAMERAIAKAKQYGFGAAVVRNSNHFGVGGYYAMMAEREDMLGTNPIAFAMPADPIPMLYDVATTVVPRGKLEVYAKQGKPMPLGWAVDENGKDTSDAKRVIDNINSKAGGGILPLGGSSPATGSHKGYGLALIVEILSSIIAGGATSNYVSKNGLGDTSQSFFALDYGMFGDKAAMRESLSTLLQELRDSAKAEGRTRIYTSGEMEVDSRNEKLKNGIPVNDSTLAELRTVGGELGLDFDAMVSVKAAE